MAHSAWGECVERVGVDSVRESEVEKSSKLGLETWLLEEIIGRRSSLFGKQFNGQLRDDSKSMSSEQDAHGETDDVHGTEGAVFFGEGVTVLGWVVTTSIEISNKDTAFTQWRLQKMKERQLTNVPQPLCHHLLWLPVKATGLQSTCVLFPVHH